MAVVLAASALPATAAEKTDKTESDLKALIAGFQGAWAKHDYKAMAGFWAEDGDLINPWGRVAKGRAEVEKLFQDEQTGPLKTTEWNPNITSWRMLDKDAAVVDLDAAMTHMVGPDGKPAPDWAHHVFFVAVSKAGKWWFASARPYEFSKPMPAPQTAMPAPAAAPAPAASPAAPPQAVPAPSPLPAK